jgi:hypothetical protein
MNQHQDYDKILKENIEKVGKSILSKICKIEVDILEDVSTTIPRTIERRVDFLKMGTDKKTGERFLSHLEFQAESHAKMDKRLLVYYALFYEVHDVIIKQYVIYLGTGNWTAPMQINHPNLQFRYEVICLNTIDYEVFIHSENPEEIILTILADFKGQNKAQVIQQIIKCLKDKTKNKRRLQKYIMQLEILSNLRNLQTEIIKQLSTMSIAYDVRTDLRYLQGKEEGEESKNRKIIISLLENGLLSVKDIAEIAEVSLEFVLNIQKGMKTKKK